MRVLLTGLGTFWGSRLALALEHEPAVDLIVGVDTREPRLALEKTEFVRTDSSYSILQRIVKATKIDTILHTHLITDSTEVSGRALHEVNVIGTANLLAAAGAAGSTVRKVVMKSSTHVYGCSFDDPYWFREETLRKHPPRTRVERSLVAADDIVREFAEDEPDVVVTRLRFADTLGGQLESAFSRILAEPVVPEVLGFDPRLQFVHDDDAVRALAHATVHRVPGVFNIAGQGVEPWGEVCSVVGRRRVPLPPLLTALATEPLRMLRVANIPREVLRLLRYGRAVDPSRYQHEGFRYEHTTAGAIHEFAKALRVRASLGDDTPDYRYEQDVEAFFRHSPAVVRDQ